MNYYPFGLSHSGEFISAQGSNYKYKYQGKEIQEENGLLQYDFGSRLYDASVGRWFVLDPQAESFYGMSPYMAMGNNPIIIVDPNGEKALPFALIFRGLAFLGDFTSNLINGKGDALGSAWENSTNAFEGMSSALQVPIAQGENFNASFGINPFGFSASVNASYKVVGNWTLSRSAGYGAFSGAFVSAGTSFDDGTHSFGSSSQVGKNYSGNGFFYKYKLAIPCFFKRS